MRTDDDPVDGPVKDPDRSPPAPAPDRSGRREGLRPSDDGEEPGYTEPLPTYGDPAAAPLIDLGDRDAVAAALER